MNLITQRDINQVTISHIQSLRSRGCRGRRFETHAADLLRAAQTRGTQLRIEFLASIKEEIRIRKTPSQLKMHLIGD